MAYVKNTWDVKTFHQGDSKMINNLNHIESGIEEGGKGKIWYTVPITQDQTNELVKVGQLYFDDVFSQDANGEYSGENFESDYINVLAYQNPKGDAGLISYGEEMNYVCIDLDKFTDVYSYLAKSLPELLAYNGFDYNYYKTLALFAACPFTSGGGLVFEEKNPDDVEYVLESQNVMYIQDVTQQYYEYNYGSAEEAEKAKASARENLEEAVYGAAVVISLKGYKDQTSTESSNFKNNAFLYCLQDSNACYWDSSAAEGTRLKWARIEAEKFYPVHFDTQYETSKWLLNAVEPATEAGEIYAKQITDNEKAALKAPTYFSKSNGSSRVCADTLYDESMKLKAPLIGVKAEYISRVISFNSQFEGETETLALKFIARPMGYQAATLDYLVPGDEEGEYVDKFEQHGYYLWQLIENGTTIDLIAPDNCDAYGVPHRNALIATMSEESSYSYGTLYRHTFTVKPNVGQDIPVFIPDELMGNMSLMAVNSQYGETGVDYLLLSDQVNQSTGDPDWILPATGEVCLVDYRLLSAVYSSAPQFVENKFYSKNTTTTPEKYELLLTEPEDWENTWVTYYTIKAKNDKWYSIIRMVASWKNIGTAESPNYIRSLKVSYLVDGEIVTGDLIYNYSDAYSRYQPMKWTVTDYRSVIGSYMY